VSSGAAADALKSSLLANALPTDRRTVVDVCETLPERRTRANGSQLRRCISPRPPTQNRLSTLGEGRDVRRPAMTDQVPLDSPNQAVRCVSDVGSARSGMLPLN